MATSRSARKTRDVNSLREVAIHAAHLQLASLTAASRFFAGWAHAADRYAQVVGDELLDRLHGKTPPDSLTGRLAAATRTHLRDLSELPTLAVDHFNEQISERREPRTRQSA